MYATEQTAEFLVEKDVPVTKLNYGDPDGDEGAVENCIDDFISRGDIHLVLMFSNQFSERILLNYAIRRLAVDYGVPLITNKQVASMFAEALRQAGTKATPGVANSNVILDTHSLQDWYA